jgi:aspartate/methionine/tyrosine aminotransferase
MDYLAWAVREMPRARLDLGTSGVPMVGADELGSVPRLAEWGALGDFVDGVAHRYGVAADEVVPALGAAGGLWLLATALLGPGDHAVIEAPVYEPVQRIIEGRGAQVSAFRRQREDGWRIDMERVLEATREDTRVVVVTNPHNPSGVHLGDDELRPLAAALERRGIDLVVDEVYRELCEPRATARHLGNNVSMVSSLTKCFGLGWARAGWVIARRELAARMQVATMHLSGVLPATVGAVGALGLREVDRLGARARALISGKRERVCEWVDRHARHLVWHPPHPALHFGFVEDRRGADLGPRLARGLEQRGVLVVPGAFFGVPSAFRISWTLPSPSLDEALRELAAALDLGA